MDVVEADPSDRRFVERFIRVQWTVQAGAPAPNRWVPPLLMDRRDVLDPRKHPFYEHADLRLFIVRDGGRDVGRIAGIVDHDYVRHVGAPVGHFGFFDAPDDPAVVSALWQAVTQWLRARGMTRVVGPFDPSANYMLGVLVEGFDHAPTVNMPYNPPWYDTRLRALGLGKAKDLLQWEFWVDQPLPARIERVSNVVARKSGVRIRSFDFKDWDREVDRTLAIYNDAWEDNWGFVPLSAKEYRHIAKDLKLVLHPEMGIMAEVEGEAVGFAVSIMNINPTLAKLDGRLLPFGLFRLVWDLYVRKSVDTGRLILMGVKRKFHRRGLDALLILETYRRCRAIGWRGGELGWTLEDNEAINAPIRSVGAKEIARYRMYEMELTQ